MNTPNLPFLLGLIAVCAPVILVASLGIPTLLGRPLSERLTDRLGQITIWTGLLASLSVLAWMLTSGETHLMLVGRNWVEIPGYHFAFKLVFDRLSIPFVILSFLLCGTIGAFAARYLHREPGFNRFFSLFSLFLLGMVVTSLAGTIETLFAGWELVGLSSTLLVAFYHERRAPVANGLHVWTVYRISDASLLLASVVLHHLTGEGDFDRLFRGVGNWPVGQPAMSPAWATLVGFLLVAAASGKSALIPFSGWLPRAMEGPTPSSAVFYGALSVHLGAFLLLRVSPLLDASPLLAVALVGLGLLTSAHAFSVGQVQTDIKSALTYASLTQVGLIVAEIGLGFRYLALVHILGHACWRTLQFVRAPTLLHDQRILEDATAGQVASRSTSRHPLLDSLPATWRLPLYRLALSRGRLDLSLTALTVKPLLRLLRTCESWESTLTAWAEAPLHISGTPADPTVLAEPASSADPASRAVSSTAPLVSATPRAPAASTDSSLP